MGLKDILRERKPDIVKAWFEAVIATYHEETREPLRKAKAQFANPVGFNLAEGLDGFFDAMLQEMLPDTVSQSLDVIVRIRAIQDFTPSEAVGFVFQLKRILRETLGTEALAAPGAAAELAKIESVIDDLALFAFDLYMRCREKIYDLKAQEARNATFRLLQKAQAMADKQEQPAVRSDKPQSNEAR